MARIKTKNSTTAASVPASGSLLRGEIAINIADKKLYVGNASGNPVEITSQGVTTVTGTPSGVYVTQATGSTTIGLQTNVFVSGSLHVSGVLTESPAALNIFASEDSMTSESRMINMKSYAGNHSEINVADDGTLILKSQANVVSINPTGTSPVYFDTASSTGYLYVTPTDILIGINASGVLIGHATGVVTVGNLAVNSGTISTNAATATLFNATATTITIGSAATTTNIAANTAAQTINIGAGANAAGVTKTINIGTGATLGATTTNITLGPTASSTGTITINGRANVIGPYATGITIGGLQLDSGATATGVINIGTNAVLGGHKIINIGTNGTSGNSTITIGNNLGPVILQGSTGSGIMFTGGPARLLGFDSSTDSSIRATGSIVGWGSVQSTGHMLAASGYRINSNTINAQTATGYTLQASDNGRIITFNSAATHTLRIPTGLDIGFNATIIQLGTGQITCTGLSGATVNCYASGNKTLGQHASASILCYASNTYNLGGTLGI